MKPILLFFVAALALMTGCASYDYRVLQPVSITSAIKDQPITVMYEPLQYSLSRYRDRLGMTIINPTTNQIVLRGDRSYAVDPRGESHPVRGRVIAPHSYAAMLWPPLPASHEVISPAYYGQAWAPGYPYMWGDYYYYGPGVSFYRVNSPYDWNWDVGEAHIHLTYDENGREFDHEFVILREREK
jgi:hypothetical protein